MRTDIRDVASKVVFRLLADLTDRAGLSDAWDSVDEDTRLEILGEWTLIVAEELRK